MSVALFTSPTVVRIGPGYLIACVTTVGPTALDDLLLVELIDPTTTQTICYGSAFWSGFTNQAVLMGRVVNGVHPVAGHQAQVQAGDTVDLVMRHTNVAGTPITSGLATGLVWDPVNGIGALTTALGPGGSIGLDATLTDILSAVRRTYP